MARISQAAKQESKGSRSKNLSRHRPWTPDGDMVLLQLYEEGYSVSQIGEILNRTSQSVGRRLSQLQARGYRLPKPERRADEYAWPSRMGVVSGHLV
ncbi:MAG TPA: hypothetical protein VIL08_07170 [Limnochorda sp.]